ncbi:hypothetical protein [Roseimaritima ulvae]|uniref:DUF3352 domain-containing protein n=1 Tax=Roseimaritima ulvae TaxID=980254 RepID=A0A5B9QN47_9BACT|nr:hypothetical protein [Roseimaritima ulvae]QEG40384.1 hypothetical protein UC8_23940 [Roseimaritima ulvae]
MHTFSERRIALCLLVAFATLAFGASPANAQLPKHALQQLPASTAAAIVAGQANPAFDKLMQIGPVRAFNGPAFSSFRKALQQRVPTNWLNGFPLPEQQARQLLGDGSFGMVIVETSQQLPERCFLLEMDANYDDWRSLIKTYVSQAENDGAKVERTSLNGHELWLVSSPGQATGQAILRVKDWLVIGESRECMQQWVAAATTTTRLVDDQRYTNTIGPMGGQYANEGDVWVFVDPLRLDYLDSRAGGQELASFAETFGARHGFDAIRACGGWVNIGGPQYDASYRLRVWAPQPHDRGMQLLRWQAMENPSPSSWIPNDRVCSCVTIDWNLQPILKNLGPLVDEVIRETTGKSEQTLEAILAQLRAEDGPGIDLEKDFMPLLGPRIEFISFFTPPASETAEQSIVAIELSNDREVADLLAALIEDDGATPLEISGFPFELWKMGSGRRVGDSGPSFSTPGAMVAHGKLFFASNYLALRQFVAIKPQPEPLASDPTFQQLEAKLKTFAGEKPAMRIIAFPDRDFQNTYELLRTGRADSAESIYTTLLTPMLKDSTLKIPFELLPTFDAIRPALGPACIQMNVVPDGYEISGMTLSTAMPATP